jgi:hypothetical protein
VRVDRITTTETPTPPPPTHTHTDRERGEKLSNTAHSMTETGGSKQKQKKKKTAKKREEKKCHGDKQGCASPPHPALALLRCVRRVSIERGGGLGDRENRARQHCYRQKKGEIERRTKGREWGPAATTGNGRRGGGMRLLSTSPSAPQTHSSSVPHLVRASVHPH